MRRRRFQISLVAVVVAALGLSALFIPNLTARADVGNQGTPVRCYASGGAISHGETQFMTCVRADGGYPGFVNSQRVPSGYYFMVTDVFVTPLSGGNGSTTVTFYLFDAYGTSGRASSYTFRSLDGASYGQHFTVPLYVLPADHRIEIQAFNANAADFDLRITGVLTTNVNYLPLVVNN